MSEDAAVPERWKRTTSSQWVVWGKRSTGTAATGENGVPFTRSDGLLQRLCVCVCVCVCVCGLSD